MEYRLIDLAAKNDDQFEVRRAETLCVPSAADTTVYKTMEAVLSSDGRTVTSLREADNGLQRVEIWDSGRGSICRV